MSQGLAEGGEVLCKFCSLTVALPVLFRVNEGVPIILNPRERNAILTG